jgi:abhydrolase domain-containing protein 17
MKIFIIIVGILVTSYLLSFLVVALVFNSVIFNPPNQPKSESHYGDTGLLQLKTADNINIVARYLPNKKAKYTILYSHGNAEDLESCLSFLQMLHDHGFSVFAYDYHGYGLSGGKPTEANTYLDIDAAYNYLTQNLQIKPKNIILFGYSLGGAVTMDLAVRKPIGAVILQGAFVTALRVATQVSLLPFSKFNNLKKIKQLTSPVLIIHGTDDKVVSFWHGKELYSAAISSLKHFYAAEGAGHNNLLLAADNGYWHAINNFVKNIKDINRMENNEKASNL